MRLREARGVPGRKRRAGKVMTTAQDTLRERNHYEELFRREGEHDFIGNAYEWLHAKTVNLLRPGARILDIGCGVGHHAYRFARKGFYVCGVDLSPTAIEKTRELFDRLSLSGEFICADARELPWENDVFDAAFLSLVLHRFADYGQVLAEAARVARKYVFVIEPNAFNPETFMRLNIVNRFFRRRSPTRDERALNPGSVRRFMEACGFEERAVHFVTLGATEEYSWWKGFVHWLHRPLPPRARHNKFVQVFAARRPGTGLWESGRRREGRTRRYG